MARIEAKYLDTYSYILCSMCGKGGGGGAAATGVSTQFASDVHRDIAILCTLVNN